jgi:WD40 repeat protein
VGEAPDPPSYATYSPKGDVVAATYASGEVRIWSTASRGTRPIRTLQGPEFDAQSFAVFDPSGRRLSHVGPSATHTVWDLDAFPDARPLVVGRPGPTFWHLGSFDPTSRWLALGDLARTTVEFWPVESPRRRVLPGFASAISLAFSPDSRWLATCPYFKPARLWPASASEGRAQAISKDPDEPCVTLAMRPGNHSVLVGTAAGGVMLYPFPGGTPRSLLEGWAEARLVVAFDPSGRRAVASPQKGLGDQAAELRVLRLWDLATGQDRVYSIAHLTDAAWALWCAALAPDGRVYLSGPGGVRRLSLPSEPGGIVSAEMIHAAGFAGFDLSREGRLLLVAATRSPGIFDPREDLLLLDLVAQTTRRITSHGAQLMTGVLSRSGRIIVTGGHDGILRVGPVTGEEPHLLLGHKGPITGLAVSPDERWIASSSDESITIWPMPDVTKPPLHTLPHAELMATLDALTNLRVVRDPAEPTGWKLEVGPFPGWKDVPTW